MKRLSVVLGLLAGSTFFGGCINGYPQDPHEPGTPRAVPPPDPVADPDPYGDYDGTVAISNAHLSGDMGDVHGFDADATYTSGMQSYGVANLTVMTTNASAGYSAMAIFDVEGGLDHPALTPGASLHFDGYEGEQGLYIYVTGCSGPREGSWLFDSGAEQVNVDVSEGSTPGTLRMDFDATFTGNGTTEGSFEVQVPQA